MYEGTQPTPLISVAKAIQKQICEQLVRHIIKNVVNFGNQNGNIFCVSGGAGPLN